MKYVGRIKSKEAEAWERGPRHSRLHTTVPLGELPGWEQTPSTTDLLVTRANFPLLPGSRRLICEGLSWSSAAANEALLPGGDDAVLQEKEAPG